MEITQRIPLEQYAYIEFTKDYESVEDALADHAAIISMNTEPGLPEREWAQIRNRMFLTGEADPNIEGLSRLQKYVINQFKLALRAHKAGDPVIK
jgi:hypothetical protein